MTRQEIYDEIEQAFGLVPSTWRNSVALPTAFSDVKPARRSADRIRKAMPSGPDTSERG